jgi:hypothetical protein
MYKALNQANIKAKYECKTYEIMHTNDKQIAKVNIKIEEIRKYVVSIIHRTLWELALSLNVRVDPTSLFLYAGSYSKLMLLRIYQRLNFINHKIKKNATRR